MAYLLDCITTGYDLTQLFVHRDIRTTGSGNVESRNVERLPGSKGFVGG